MLTLERLALPRLSHLGSLPRPPRAMRAPLLCGSLSHHIKDIYPITAQYAENVIEEGASYGPLVLIFFPFKCAVS